MKASAGGGGRLRRAAGIVFVSAAFVFLALFVVGNLEDLRAHSWSVRPGMLLLSLLVHVLGLVWGVWVWQLLLRRMSVHAPLHGLARVWFVSGLGRYIPGKIWQFVGAAHLGGNLGISGAATVTSLAAQTGVFLVAALLTATFLLPGGLGEVVGLEIGPLRWFAPLLLLLLHPRVIGGALALLRRATRRPLSDWRGGWMDGIWLGALACVGWGLTGTALYLFLIALTPLPDLTVTATIGINALAFVVGYAVFIAPAGLGAKEGALAALLSFYVPLPVAALLAVAARLWTVAAEVIPALLLLRARPSVGGDPAVPAEAP